MFGQRQNDFSCILSINLSAWCVSFWLHGYCGEWEGGPANQVNHTSWVVVHVVTPTDRPKSVRNLCLIELFCGVVCVVTLSFSHFCWCRGFCHRTWSDLLLFVITSNSLNMTLKKNWIYIRWSFSIGYFERYVNSKGDYLELLLSVNWTFVYLSSASIQ